MYKQKKRKSEYEYFKVLIIVILIVLAIFTVNILFIIPHGKEKKSKKSDKIFRLISSTENQDLEDHIMEFAMDNDIDLEITYYGTIDMMQILNGNFEDYDAAWPSNSIWLSLLESDVRGKIINSKFTSINPVIFGIDIDVATELGFVGRDDIKINDIVDATKSGKLKFIMSSATQTNSGASAYLGFLSSLAGNTQVLTSDILSNQSIKDDLSSLLNGVEKASGSEDYSINAYLQGDGKKFNSVVGYESSIIHINKQLENTDRSPLYAIYPVDGVSLSDSPFAYIDNGNDKKLEEFTILQEYLTGEEMQKYLTSTGRRGGYGGLVPYADKSVFNPEWGIDTEKYLSPIKYPSSTVIKEALNMYQNDFRKPSYTVFCLDYSGSMAGQGHRDLSTAMELILNTESASERMIQFSENDVVEIVPFSYYPSEAFGTSDGYTLNDLADEVKGLYPSGGTDIYKPTYDALRMLNRADTGDYIQSIILMTDGLSDHEESFFNIESYYKDNDMDVPIFCITFGDADTSQLEQLAEMSGGMVFDGTTDLIYAFQTVRGYS